MKGIFSTNRKRLLVLTLIIALLVPAACTSTPAVSAIPPEVTQYAKDWPLPNKDYANTRATADATINSGNVKNLGVAWAIPLPGQGIYGAASTTPIIMGNTIYFQDLGNNVFAIDLATGAINSKPSPTPIGIARGTGADGQASLRCQAVGKSEGHLSQPWLAQHLLSHEPFIIALRTNKLKCYLVTFIVGNPGQFPRTFV